MKNTDVIWLDEFYNTIKLYKIEVPYLVELLGDIINTSVNNSIRNEFLLPKDKRFKTIYISWNIITNEVKEIGFIGNTFTISFLDCKKYSKSHYEQFIIYDEKVEFVFDTQSTNNLVKNIVCRKDESALNLSEEDKEDLIFDNINFILE
ncbi:MAG: hypothetical protein V4538_17615 [Bacteroidota bacterium]